MKITSQFIRSLDDESAKAIEICSALEVNKSFANTTLRISNESLSKAHFIILHDIVKIFKEYADLPNADVNSRLTAKFTLIYLYEAILGNNLGQTYNLEKLNGIPTSNHFEKNVELISNTKFLNPIESVKEEYLFPLILFYLKSDLLESARSLLIRITSLLVKSDGSITPMDEEFIKRVTDKINNSKIISSAHQIIPDDDTLEKVMSELNELIGLDNIKKNVEDLTNFLKVQQLREEKGLKKSNTSLHAVFMGPPGTGKTTVARLLGRIYKHLGYLNKGHLIETDRAGLVAGYVGQTAIKTEEMINQALDGVLFIDEAYAMTSGSMNDYGSEAIEVLLKRMEDNRVNLVVVVAGYPDEMEIFIQSNPGLQSRFNRYFKFDHYSIDALLNIFKLYAKKADFILSEEAEEKLLEIIERVHEKKHSGFGNARTMRNLFEKIIERQANRVVKITPVTKGILQLIAEPDIPEVLDAVNEIMIFNEESN
ncbi:AAA family ATPase [Fulvivirga sp.]|uniref:AAA family ATPase n=1 Tax=Fulvivirga sp. TaxID=1931237 RepID=UPI0032EB1733